LGFQVLDVARSHPYGLTIISSKCMDIALFWTGTVRRTARRPHFLASLSP